MQAFIRNRGATVCPPMAERSFNPARAVRDDSAFQPFSVREELRSDQTRLAHAKILAMLKLLSGCKDGTTRNDFLIAVSEARRWFFEPNHDFELWCDDAGFDPEHVRQKARRVELERIPTASRHKNERDNIAELNRHAEIQRWKQQKATQ